MLNGKKIIPSLVEQKNFKKKQIRKMETGVRGSMSENILYETK